MRRYINPMDLKRDLAVADILGDDRTIEEIIDAIPTANVKEIVYAKWEWYNAWEGDDTFNEWKMLRCSNCLESEGARENARYCPNCGAKMDVENEDDE